jgi:hypothetical protein
MATRILLVSLFLSLLVACDKKEDDMNPGKNYTGTLTLEYSRTFPTFKSFITLDVEINQAGEVILLQPSPVNYSGESEKMLEGNRIKLREEGSITVTSPLGEWMKRNGKDYLSVDLTSQLTGRQILWAYDGYNWMKVSETPFTHDNPVECPMLFRIENAVMAEAICGATCCDNWGNACFRWRLVLNAAP